MSEKSRIIYNSPARKARRKAKADERRKYRMNNPKEFSEMGTKERLKIDFRDMR